MNNIRYSRCRSCGKEIIWAKKKDGGYHRPLVLNDTAAILIIDGIVSEDFVTTYKLHKCNPIDVENYKETAQAEYDQRREYEEALFRAQTEALRFSCVKCGAEIGEACINLTKKKKGIIEKVQWPHLGRIPSDALGGKEIP